MNKKISTSELTLIGLGIALNVIGAFVALNLRLPIYLDSIGTIFVACILGPKYAIITGICGSMVSGMTFDIYSFFFIPVQISTGLISGLIYKKGLLNGMKTPLGVLIFAIPTSIISATIVAFVFEGITSSGSSYVVQILSLLGINQVVSVFITQVLTDYIDKFIAVLLVNSAVLAIPSTVIYKLKASKI